MVGVDENGDNNGGGGVGERTFDEGGKSLREGNQHAKTNFRPSIS